MPSAKHNLTMDKATGLIFSLFDVTLSQDMPFRQPRYVQCMYHGLTFVLFCVPVLFADARCQFSIVRYSFPLAVSCFSPTFSIVTGFIAEKFLVLFFICNGPLINLLLLVCYSSCIDHYLVLKACMLLVLRCSHPLFLIVH